MSVLRSSAVLTAAVVLACGREALPGIGGTTTSADPITTMSTNSASLTSTSAADSSSSGDSSSSTGGPPEIEMCANNYPSENCDVDWAVRNYQPCNPWVDDCGPGAACRFLDGYTTQCVALAEQPRGLYEACEWEAQDCDKGLECHGLPDTLGYGYCIPQCSCHPERPHCADASHTCDYAGYGPPSCVSRCDLLDPVCPEPGFACYPWGVPSCGANFVGLTLPLGAQCTNSGRSDDYCAPGLFCTEGGPACGTATCCSPFCSLDDPNACADLGEEFTCASDSELLRLPCYEGIGVCRSK